MGEELLHLLQLRATRTIHSKTHKLVIFGNTQNWENILMQGNILCLIYVRLTLCLHTSMLREAHVGQRNLLILLLPLTWCCIAILHW